MKNFGAKLEKLHFYVVILAMFKFTVIMPITAKMETVLRLLGTYEIILKRNKEEWLKAKSLPKGQRKYEIIVYSAYWLNFNFANCASLSYASSLKSSDAFVIAEGRKVV